MRPTLVYVVCACAFCCPFRQGQANGHLPQEESGCLYSLIDHDWHNMMPAISCPMLIFLRATTEPQKRIVPTNVLAHAMSECLTNSFKNRSISPSKASSWTFRASMVRGAGNSRKPSALSTKMMKWHLLIRFPSRLPCGTPLQHVLRYFRIDISQLVNMPMAC